MLREQIKSEKGSGLVVVFLLIIVGGVFIMALGSIVTSRIRSTGRNQNSNQAYYIARSAALTLFRELQPESIGNLKPDYEVDSNGDGENEFRESNWHQFGDNPDWEYRVEVGIGVDTDISQRLIERVSEGKGNIDNEILQINAVGRVNDGSRNEMTERVTLIAAPEGFTQNSSFQAAVTVLDKLILEKGIQSQESVIKGGDGSGGVSSIGVKINSIATPDCLEDNNSNDTMAISAGTCIIGPNPSNSNLQEELKNELMGYHVAHVKKKETLTNYVLPLFPNFPNDLPNRGNLTIDISTTDPTIDNDGFYPEITVKEGNTLTINLGEEDRELRVDRLNLESHAELRIKDPTESRQMVNLYVNQLDLGTNVKINTDLETNPSGDRDFQINIDQLMIFYNGRDEFFMRPGQQIFGNIFVESANVDLAGSGNLAGNLVSGGTTVNIDNGYTSRFNENTKSDDHSKLIFAPQAEIRLSAPQQDGIKGAVLGNRVVIWPNFTVEKADINTGMLPFDFAGGRKYEDPQWID